MAGAVKMSQPRQILEVLDGHLSATVELVLYGRAALALGFEHTREEFAATMDVDAILPLADLPKLERNDAFWDALDATNMALEAKGLYMTHLFVEDQVILSKGWWKRVVPIQQESFKYLKLCRPDLGDLILTKMMRVDPQDRADIDFLLEMMEEPEERMAWYFENARIPQIREIEDAFDQNKTWLKLAINKGRLT